METPKNDQEYFAMDSMSNSMLKYFKRSPAHYLQVKNNKTEQTPAMAFGSAFHCFVLEPDRFLLEFAVKEKADGRTKEGKAYNEEFATKNANKTIITSEDFECLKSMKTALEKHEFAMELLNIPGECEKPFMWVDKITGVQMKAKMDKVCADFTIDLKTTQDAEPSEFARYAFNNYLTQPAVYCDARKANGMTAGDFYFIAIEKVAPFGISIQKCSSEFIEHGKLSYQETLQNFAYWLEMGKPVLDYQWKDSRGFFDLELPNWIK